MTGRSDARALRVTDAITVPIAEIEQSAVRASGPGGQNVNKVATAVQLRFDVRRSTALPEEVRDRLARIAGRRMTSDGVLVIDARRYRSQERNRQDALERLAALIRSAATPRRIRRPTRPTVASKVERLDAKGRQSELKRRRRTHREAE